MNHIMLDLETLDTKTSAVVLSIGAVAFDPYSKDLGTTFYVEMTEDTAAQQARGRTISGDTVTWWMQQNVLARRLFASPPSEGVERVTTVEALARFATFIGAHGDDKALIWGNGADFDNIILGSLYEDLGYRKPWSYGRNRCFRTMKNIPHAPGLQLREGVHHNALDDAVTQAKHLQEINAWLASL